MRLSLMSLLATFALLTPGLAQGDMSKGRNDFRACAACHSLEPGRNMTGPSLAQLWGRTAGSLPNFDRYSSALKSSGIVWNDQTLEQWLTDPQHLVPNNEMPFEGIKDASVRVDLLAYLKEATKPGATAQQGAQSGQMGGMMGGAQDPNLKTLDPSIQVKAITYCRDTYRVTTADGKTHTFWERNLRFQDRHQQGRSGEGCAGDHAGGHDGGPRFDNFFPARRN